MILVVGLGNPGRRYEGTRHNVGFEAVGRIAARAGVGAWREKFRGRYALGELGGQPLIALMPQTFMNESGRSVQPAAAFYKVAPEAIVVVHDELDLPLGTVRLKQGGGDAGHRGLKSIRQEIGSGETIRLRIGIGRPPPEFRGRGRDYVLEAFPSEDRAVLPEVLDRATEAVARFAERGLADAMNVTNQRKS